MRKENVKSIYKHSLYKYNSLSLLIILTLDKV